MPPKTVFDVVDLCGTDRITRLTAPTLESESWLAAYARLGKTARQINVVAALPPSPAPGELFFSCRTPPKILPRNAAAHSRALHANPPSRLKKTPIRAKFASGGHAEKNRFVLAQRRIRRSDKGTPPTGKEGFMPHTAFSKWSPGGNTTLLFPAAGLDSIRQAALAKQALEPSVLGGEQAGFVDMANKSLRMAGGEFCVNAARAVGALLACRCGETVPPLSGATAGMLPDAACTFPAPEEYRNAIRVSGWHGPVRLRARGQAPHWRVEAELTLPALPPPEKRGDAFLVRLPGICHLLVEEPAFPSPDHCHDQAAALRAKHGLTGESAAGVIWWRHNGEQPEMLPLVHVRDTDSAFLENACGSGALALALHLARGGTRRDFSIRQPGGTSLDVRLSFRDGADTAAVDGPVSLVAKGHVWLDDPA